MDWIEANQIQNLNETIVHVHFDGVDFLAVVQRWVEHDEIIPRYLNLDRTVQFTSFPFIYYFSEYWNNLIFDHSNSWFMVLNMSCQKSLYHVWAEYWPARTFDNLCNVRSSTARTHYVVIWMIPKINIDIFLKSQTLNSIWLRFADFDNSTSNMKILYNLHIFDSAFHFMQKCCLFRKPSAQRWRLRICVSAVYGLVLVHRSCCLCHAGQKYIDPIILCE